MQLMSYTFCMLSMPLIKKEREGHEGGSATIRYGIFVRDYTVYRYFTVQYVCSIFVTC